MYITITAQKLGGDYSQSSADFAEYLEKENQGLEQEDVEHFFNQYESLFVSKSAELGSSIKLRRWQTRNLMYL